MTRSHDSALASLELSPLVCLPRVEVGYVYHHTPSGINLRTNPIEKVHKGRECCSEIEDFLCILEALIWPQYHKNIAKQNTERTVEDGLSGKATCHQVQPPERHIGKKPTPRSCPLTSTWVPWHTCSVHIGLHVHTPTSKSKNQSKI